MEKPLGRYRGRMIANGGYPRLKPWEKKIGKGGI